MWPQWRTRSAACQLMSAFPFEVDVCMTDMVRVLLVQTFLPVNGTGVVFYMDSAGAIRGVLIWGIPTGEDDDSGGGLEVRGYAGRVLNV